MSDAEVDYEKLPQACTPGLELYNVENLPLPKREYPFYCCTFCDDFFTADGREMICCGKCLTCEDCYKGKKYEKTICPYEKVTRDCQGQIYKFSYLKGTYFKCLLCGKKGELQDIKRHSEVTCESKQKTALELFKSNVLPDIRKAFKSTSDHEGVTDLENICSAEEESHSIEERTKVNDDVMGKNVEEKSFSTGDSEDLPHPITAT